MNKQTVDYDVVVAGRGPAGLQANLTLARARKRVLSCDAGPRRNARATGIQNFLTRDGVAPDTLRALAREETLFYGLVDYRESGVASVEREGAHLRVTLDDGSSVRARRVLVATGVVDELPPIKGIADVWGHQVFQCPYCHGWEARDRAWAVLVEKPELLPWARLLRGWTSRLVILTNGNELPQEERRSLELQGIRVRTARIERLVTPSRDGEPHLTDVALVGESPEPCEALFVRPVQRPAPLVTALGLALDEQGFVRLDEQRQSSMPGVYVAGDATTPMQAAIFAAQTGMATAAFLVHGLVHETLVDP